MIKLVLRWIEDDADLRACVFDVGDRDVPVRNAAQKIVRAVDRVDNPATIELTGEVPRRFFAEKSVIRKRSGELATEEIFDLAIGDAHEIARPLELDDELLAAIPIVERNCTGLPRNRASERIAIFHDGMDSARTRRIGPLTSRSRGRSCKDCNDRVQTWEQRRDACRYRSFTVHRKRASEGLDARRRRRNVSM